MFTENIVCDDSDDVVVIFICDKYDVNDESFLDPKEDILYTRIR